MRRNIYWLLDGLKGGRVKQYCDEMRRCYENGIDSDAQQKQLNILLQHTVDTTKYYSVYSNFTDLSDFPVLSKADYKDNYDSFLSDKYLNNKNNRCMTTSGSTGTPFAAVQDSIKIARCRASVIFFGQLCGYEIGMKQGYFRVWVESIRKSKLGAFKQNIYMVDVTDMSDNSLVEVCDQLQKQRIKSILCYATALDTLSKYILKHKPVMKFPYIESVISCAETLEDNTKKNLETVFDCPVVSRYSNMENGIIAQQPIGSNNFYIDSSSYIMELLKIDSDYPAEDGELGRIVLTDLFNYAFPMIRYDTGDTGIMARRDEHGRTFLTALYGRRVDLIYGYDGQLISPHAITNNMWLEGGIRQFKFSQIGVCDYKLEINGDSRKIDVEKTVVRLKTILGDNANISVGFVEEIPIMASGKRKYIENLWRAQ